MSWDTCGVSRAGDQSLYGIGLTASPLSTATTTLAGPRRRSHLSKDSSHDDGGGGGIGSPLAPGVLVVGPARTSSGVPTSAATDTGTSQPSHPTPQAQAHMHPGGVVTTSGNHSAPPSTTGPAHRSSLKSLELAPLSLGLIGAGSGGGPLPLPLSLSPTGLVGGARGLSQAPSATLLDLHSGGLQVCDEGWRRVASACVWGEVAACHWLDVHLMATSGSPLNHASNHPTGPV